MKKFLEAGKIVGTHGVRGALRVQLWCDSADFLKQFKYFYTDDSGSNRLEVLSIQPHGNVALMTLKGVNSIELAERLRNKVIYIDRKDAKLPDNRYFISDLIGCSVTDADSELYLGKITDISQTGANDVWHITNNNNEYLIPAIDDVIISVDIESSNVIIRPLKGIFDDED